MRKDTRPNDEALSLLGRNLVLIKEAEVHANLLVECLAPHGRFPFEYARGIQYPINGSIVGVHVQNGHS